MNPSQTDWRERYEALAKETRQVYASVYCMLVDTERMMDVDQRISFAANELYWAGQSLEAREVFDKSEVSRG